MNDLLLDVVNNIKSLLEHSKEEVRVEEVKVRSFTECPECGENINNGYFKLTINSTKPIFLSYINFHDMNIHLVYNEEYGATDSNVNELLRENSKRNPRDQLSINEIESKVSKYSLSKLDQIIKKMITD